MKKIKGVVLRRLGGEAMIVAESLDMIDFDRLVSLNSSAAYVWEALGESEFDVDTIAGLLSDRYEVSAATALADARELAERWLEAGIVE